jgi:hypothetical protein
MTTTENLSERTRTQLEETEMLLSLVDCVVLEREAVYGSSEIFTGQRFYDLCIDNEARTAEELEKKLGPQYKTILLAKNKEKGVNFLKKLRELGHKIVITPVAFTATPFWSNEQYKDFWSQVIARKCRIVCMNEGWQFSETCVCDYLAGLKGGKKVLDHVGNLLVLDAARKAVTAAVRRLEDFGFEVPDLRKALTELKSFSSLG